MGGVNKANVRREREERYRVMLWYRVMLLWYNVAVVQSDTVVV